MLLTGFPSIVFGTNCYLMATAPNSDCVIVDPGIGVIDELRALVTTHGLRPVAIVLTHGHLDHVYGVTPLSQEYGIPVHIHAADRYRLADPISTLDPGLFHALAQQSGDGRVWTEPEQIREFTDGQVLDLAGLRIRVLHVPGHTEGSVLLSVQDRPRRESPGVDAPEGIPLPPDVQNVTSTVLSGDVLFAGSVGRTDLPGGDRTAMARSLGGTVLALPDDTLVLPGHGAATTIARERRENPFLRDLSLVQE
jgi:glyoxylase-like metal-dependent hydrolase (beta-lactamase superfamily II)